ncbi:MAG: hypothetical protein Tsb009_10240 [Planctomycetaceae bacterium]
MGVVLVFDQLRADYLTRWRSHFVKGGFRRLTDEGLWFQNCHYPYSGTFTAPGHASVSTGCSPNTHGIIANNWYDRNAHKVITSVAMSPYQRVPATGSRKPFGCPKRLLAPTVADTLKAHTKGKGRVVSCSLKDRSAILPGGKQPDACYWFDTSTGEFVTSTYYQKRLHKWAAKFNAEKRVDRWFGKTWKRSRPDLDYVKLNGPDKVTGERNTNSQGIVFPHPMGPKTSKPGSGYYKSVANSPFGNEILLDFVKTAVEAEKLGVDDTPDLLCVSFSSNDLIGHTWGPDSQEVLDTTLRTDVLIRDLLKFLDEKVGRGKYVVALTADHGVCPLPEVSRKKGRDAQRLSISDLGRRAEKFLRSQFGYKPSDAANCIENYSTGMFYLNPRWLKARKLESKVVERELARWLKNQPEVVDAYTNADLSSPKKSLSPIDLQMRRSYFPGRSGDVLILTKPYDIFSGSTPVGTTHGSPYPYDTHVPLLFYEGTFPARTIQAKVTPQFIAPLISRSLGIAPPAKSEIRLPVSFNPTSFLNTRRKVARKPAVDLGTVTEKHVWIPMRDGVRLSAYLFFPKGKGPWPVLIEQRYASFRGAGTRKRYAALAEGGYVVAAVNFRGTQLSEGRYVGYRALGWGKQKDGYDAVEWLAKQPWSTGKVGSLGGSQGGFAQNFLAVTQPPSLKCQFMRDTGLSLFHEGYRIGGITRPDRFKGMARNCRDPKHNDLLLKEWFEHPHYDEYWQDEDCTRFFHKMNVPCFTLGSWYDFMNVGSVQSYIGRQHRGGANSRGKQQLMIGPWLHGGNKGNIVAEMKYPKNAAIDLRKLQLRWFDYHLKGIQNGADKDPTVRYYVMGALGEKNAPGNIWRTANDWPIPVQPTSYYLREEAGLSQNPSSLEKSSTSFLADPFKPATLPDRRFPGARDARPFEKQKDVRTFTTDVLKQPVEWTGLVKTELFVSSSARDTDFIVRISDVYPDGRSILIVSYVRRARYRNGFEKEELLVPGKITKVAFDVGWISQIFNKGHRIRITVASTGAPFYEPNPNTGNPLTIEFPKDAVVAKNKVHHDRKYRSRVIAPIPLPTTPR